MYVGVVMLELLYCVAHDVHAMLEASLNGCLSKCTEELVDKLAWKVYITRSGLGLDQIC